jgi:hypothetical protein
MQRLRNRKSAGVTVIELMMYTVLAVVLSAVIYQTLRASSLLTTKNASLNRSHDSLRSAMDRLGNNIRTSRNLPSLLGASGDVVVSGPAAGIRYDRMAGEPYTLDPVTTAGSISSTATSINIYRSVLGIAPPPLPTPNDVLLIDTPTGTARARVKTVTTQAPANGRQRISLTFHAAIGHVLTWTANQPQWAKLVRQEAFLVVRTTDGRNELRFYHAFEPKPLLSDPAAYTVITDQLRTEAGDATPFEILDVNGERFVQANVQVQSRDHNRWLADKQASKTNTDIPLVLSLSSRLRPKTAN